METSYTVCKDKLAWEAKFSFLMEWTLMEIAKWAERSRKEMPTGESLELRKNDLTLGLCLVKRAPSQAHCL